MRRCNECRWPIDPDVDAHDAHEDGCNLEPFCRCDLVVHPECCITCQAVPVVPGQLDLLAVTA